MADVEAMAALKRHVGRIAKFIILLIIELIQKATWNPTKKIVLHVVGQANKCARAAGVGLLAGPVTGLVQLVALVVRVPADWFTAPA